MTLSGENLYGLVAQLDRATDFYSVGWGFESLLALHFILDIHIIKEYNIIMSEYLDKDEFVPFAPSEIGGEVHVHHCKLGKDNDRLYITRSKDNAILAYCHHCGKRGISKLDGTRNISTFRTNKTELKSGVTKDLKFPSDFERDSSKWPVKARAWPMKYGITKEELHDNSIGYSEYHGRVVLPSFDEKGGLVQFQTRKVDGIVGTSTFQRETKYDTFIKQGSTSFQRLFDPKCIGSSSTIRLMDTLCIVEDSLSAIKCNRYVPSIALNGTSLDDKSILKVVKGYDNFIIFLDNDNPQVKKSQRKLKKKLELICRGKVTIIYSDKDPKELPIKELKGILK